MEAFARAAIEYFDAYVEVGLPHLVRRMFFSPRCRPLRELTAADLTPAFCGANDVWNNKLAAQIVEYAAEVWSLHKADMALEPSERTASSIGTYEYWNEIRAQGRCPELVDVALFWVTFETSSIAAERAFAILRQIEIPSRAAMARRHGRVN